MKELVYNGQTIHIRDGDMLSLTDMWRAADCPESGRPADWARKEGRQFIEFTAGNLNVPIKHIVKSSRGGTNPGTWAHWQIGFAYAKYLNHAFHAWCNEVVYNHIMALAKKDEARQQGKVARKVYMAACFEKGCDQRGAAEATNAGYKVFFNGKTAKKLRDEHGLKKSAPLRDHMQLSTLLAVGLYESLAAETISDMRERGSDPCITVTASCASHVKKAVLAVRNDRKTIAIEGFGWLTPDFMKRWNDEDSRNKMLQYIRQTEHNPVMIGISAHVMTIAKKSG